MSNKRTNPDFLNGVPELVVLKLLSHRPMYGYEVVQALKRTSPEALSFGEGCIYPVLHKLEAEGCLTSKQEAVNGRKRVVYRLSKPGKGKLAKAMSQWNLVVDSVNNILQGGKHVTQPSA